MRLNRRVPVGTHGGVRGRLFRVERASYSICPIEKNVRERDAKKGNA